MTAKGVTDAYPGRIFYITLANLGKFDIYLPKHQKISEIADALARIIRIKDEHFSYPSGVHANNDNSSINTAHYEPTPDHLDHIVEHGAVNEREEETVNKDCHEEVQ